jgi:transcription-repair coupling factor (superfamily II helicase)
MKLIDRLTADKQLMHAWNRILIGESCDIGRLNEGAQELLIALIENLQKPVLWFFSKVELLDRAFRFLDESGFSPIRLPQMEPHFGEKAAVDRTTHAERTLAFWKISQIEKPLVLCSLRALLQCGPSPNILLEKNIKLESGARLDRDQVVKFVMQAGYTRSARVEQLGDYSLRGGILDIFSPAQTQPIRMEFDEDRILSLRSFHPTTQISEKSLEESLILPWRWYEQNDRKLADLRKLFDKQKSQLLEQGKRSEAHFLNETVGPDLESLAQGAPFLGEEYYQPFFDRIGTVLSYLPAHTLIVREETSRLHHAFSDLARAIESSYRNSVQQGELLAYPATEWMIGSEVKTANLLPEWHGLERSLRSFQTVTMTPFEAPLNFSATTLPSYQGQLTDFIVSWKSRLKNGATLILAGHAIARYERQFLQNGISLEHFPGLEGTLQPGSTYLWPVPLSSGFDLPVAELAIVTEFELFGWHRRRTSDARYRKGRPLSSWAELKEGDYVVHQAYGIGCYLGLVTLTLDEISRDYIQIAYAGEDKLYVPSDQIYLVQKYLGDSIRLPSLSKLHSSDWSRTKQGARRAAEEVANELLQIYAQRETQKPESYRETEPWEEDLAMSFAYEETPDQEAAIQDVLKDLVEGKLTDRLICGDVGYGKTEVALRAAFRTVLAGKQVAVLAPTTILCQQHYNTFLDRLRPFPVGVEMLSRFRTPAEQKETIQRLKEGKVDIIIGTHALFNQHVSYKDLGLLIIDEEQRFGVMQKEQIRKLKADTHVLALSATPIPRTLQMSLLGLRQVSLIETAPANRFPVKTYVAEWDETLIRQALLREKERGGQVFFVHNRIQGLPRLFARIEELVPELRISLAHGQMSEERLERVMWEFAEGETDVLLCTAIIESGIDIPNANTLIVSDAQNLGLAQLYQLRGRVGRSDQHAYAYFLYPKGRALSEEAEKRLEAVRDFTHLGAGLKIAMRDLEIRGAGNILGEDQHGFMIKVGFQMYREMLEEAIERLQTGEILSSQPSRERSTIEIQTNAYVPSDYVDDEGTKMELYERMAVLNHPQQINTLQKELRDRFGPPPPALQSLLQLVRLRLLAEQVHIRHVRLEDNLLIFGWEGEPRFETERIVELAKAFPRKLRVREFDLTLRLERSEIVDAMVFSEQVLERLCGKEA